MTPEQLDVIEARTNAATQGPWEQNGYVVNASHGIGDVVADAGLAPADARFIAHARADIPALVAEVRRLHAAIDQTYALLDHWQDLGRSDGMHGRQLRQVLDSALDIDKEKTA